MKKIQSAFCIAAIIFAVACGNNNDNSDSSYPSDTDTARSYDDSSQNNTNGYPPPNTQDSSKVYDSVK
jgi:hypothetical protein